MENTGSSTSTREERQARADWLVAELRKRAAVCEDPNEQANLHRSADSLVRLATAFRG
ncbi:hypothetical protein EV646_107292 [Kribbella antiqua]|jgi:hypothetical protein|uniref:Uncharacterized protein n=1 Tax=Kribbella antiqua TaxID=2512217 RepID=A0A4R2IQK7_9ACTN|nr:hypothetical protein [Kribbella antiqua]TCO46268.1 hypothetical protein EV646_107292 [Kribbella antiqua]